jgi:hypothetical protein
MTTAPYLTSANVRAPHGLTEHVRPAVEAAKAVLEKVKETRPSQAEMKFGVKGGGRTDWLMAKSAAEGSFEVTLTWTRKVAETGAGAA